MDNNVLAKRGFSLVELSLVLMVASVFIAASFYSAAKIRQAALAQRVTGELDAIAAAGTRYYSEHGAWPVNLSDLRPSYLVQQSSGLNPFGNAYTITSNAFKLFSIYAFAKRTDYLIKATAARLWL